MSIMEGSGGGAGGLVQAVGGVGGFAEDDLGGACAGIDHAEHAHACYVGGVERGDGGGDLWWGSGLLKRITS